jgi:hypothetical protein
MEKTLSEQIDDIYKETKRKYRYIREYEKHVGRWDDDL